MKRIIVITLTAILLLSLFGCGKEPTPTTLPTTASPSEPEITETTAPIAVVNPIPDDFLCLNDMIAGSDITITVSGPKIILSEDGLTLVMSADHKDVYRDTYIMGVMKANPMIQDGAVYIHEDFFRYFFCKEGTDQVSLFHSVLFFPDEVRVALKNPDRSVFNAKLCAAICRPQSMGVALPNIDAARIFNDAVLHSMATEKHEKLRRYGYTGEYTYSEYEIIINSQTLKSEGISDDDTMTVGEYKRLEQEREHQEFLANALTEEMRIFLEQKGIHSVDYEAILRRFGDSFTQATDENLIEAIEHAYNSNLSAIGTSFYKEFLPPDSAASASGIDSRITNLDNMDDAELKDWFYDFAGEYWLDYMPFFPLSAGPSTDSGEYLHWTYAINMHNWNGAKMTRGYVEETVQTHFGITPVDHRSHRKSWSYDEATQTYTAYPEGGKSHSQYLLRTIKCTDGIYTVHATRYRWSIDPYISDEIYQQLKVDLLSGNFTELTPCAEVTLCFRLDPETMEPVFLAYVEESLIS